MSKFWNFENKADGTTELRLEGVIASETWWGDEVTPKMFRDELAKVKGDIIVWINSPGGDVFAGSQIYTALKEHEGKVTVKIDGLAASAASVVAMAGDKVEISPTASMMIHDPMMLCFGNKADLEKGIEILDEIKESIINAYELKSSQTREQIAEMMQDETWLSAKKAVALGFADKILYTPKAMQNNEPTEPTEPINEPEPKNETAPKNEPKETPKFSNAERYKYIF